MSKRNLELESRRDPEYSSPNRKRPHQDHGRESVGVRTPLPALTADDYSVGWICAITIEYVAAQECLDEEHRRPGYLAEEDSEYTLGKIGAHNVVIAVLPAGEYGTACAASVATNMLRRFPSIRIGLLVGIAGGAPTNDRDIRLGDVVVSTPHDGMGGVLQYDFGKTIQEQAFRDTGFLNQPPRLLRAALSGLQAEHVRNGHQIEETINEILRKRPILRERCQKPHASTDVLFHSHVVHDSRGCLEFCAHKPGLNLVQRQARGSSEPVIHYGLIASANNLMKDARIRDRLASEKNVLCFEMEAAGIMNHFPCLVIRGICDYSDSHKNKEWQGYAAMTAAVFTKDLLCRMISADVESVKEINNLLDNEQKKAAIESLRFNRIDDRQMNIKAAHANTCKWLMQNNCYTSWLEPERFHDHHGFLWIKGKPGAGKSTVMKYLLANSQETTTDNIILSFFFNARGNALEKSVAGMYRSLLLQLLEQRPELQDIFDSPKLKPPNGRFGQWSIDSVQAHFELAVQRVEGLTIMCFIDALDECDEDEVRDMVSFFERLGESSVNGDAQLLVCFASRHYPHITLSKGLYLVLERQSGHDQDISSYLDETLKLGHGELADQIRAEVRRKASGVFMWVVLVVQILNKEFDRGRLHTLKKKLRQIPSNLHQLFRDMLSRGDTNQDESLLCIKWILFAAKPLTPTQLYFGLIAGLEPEELGRWNRDVITPSVMERYILDCSKGLAEVTEFYAPRVQFIHESVKDFLLKDNGFSDLWPELVAGFEGQSHESLKWCCFNYIEIDIYAALAIKSSLPAEEKAEQARALDKKVPENFPFLEYAVRNILHHADAAEGHGVSQLGFLKQFQLPKWIRLFNLFEAPGLFRHNPKTSLQYILAKQDLGHLIRVHGGVASCFAVEDERYGCAMFAALATNSATAVRELFQFTTRKEPPDSPFHNLYEQYQQGSSKRSIFRQDFIFSSSHIVPAYLTHKGDEPMVVAFVLAMDDADLESEDKVYGHTTLSWAARNGHDAVVRLLLEKGPVDTETKCYNSWTPLSWASWNGHEAVVKLLLQTQRVDADAVDNNGRTPLFWAAWSGNTAVVRLLLDAGASVERKDSNGQNLLSFAAGNGQDAMVRAILQTGRADVESRDVSGFTPHASASRYSHSRVIELLVLWAESLKRGKDQS